MDAKVIDRLKSQLLISGIQQKDNPLFQVVNQLIDAVRVIGVETQAFTSSGSGGGPVPPTPVLGQSFATIEGESATLPNSRQLIAGSGISFNKTGNKLIIQGQIGPLGMDGYAMENESPIVYPQLPLIFSPYEPSWTAASSNPALGDGTLVGRVARIGQVVFFGIALRVGSTTNFGTGAWIFTLPIPAISAGILRTIFNAFARQGATEITCIGRNSTSTAIRVLNCATNTQLDLNNPFAWTNGDSLDIFGSYIAE